MIKTTSDMKVLRAPVCIRLNDKERAQLKNAAAAGDMTLSAYIRARLFDATPSPDLLPHETRQKLLAQILAELGQSGIAASLSELARAAEAGLLPLSPDVLGELRSACRSVEKIRAVLLRALGLRSGGSSCS